MANLTDKLKRDHELIIEALTEAKKLGYGPQACSERMNEIRDALLAHLAEEDEHLYPALHRAAESDTTLLTTLGFFARDMQEVTHEVQVFFDKHGEGGSGVDFAADFGRLHSLLKRRIRKEEEILYREFDKLGA